MFGVAAQPKDCATLHANNHVNNPVQPKEKKGLRHEASQACHGMIE